MQSSTPKQYLPLAGRPLIEHCLQRLLESSWISGIVVAIAVDDQHWSQLSLCSNPKIITVIGGKNRVDSVYNAVKSIVHLLDDEDFILVHDAARPCLHKQDLDRLYQAIFHNKYAIDDTGSRPVGNIGFNAGVILAERITDTIKRDDGHSLVLETVSREGLWRALTPQIFPKSVLLKALQQTKTDSTNRVTDEASAVEALGLKPRLIAGRSDNIKITQKGDIELATLILKAQSASDESIAPAAGMIV